MRAVIFDLDDTLFDDTGCTRAGLAALTLAYDSAHDTTHWPPEQLFQRHAAIIRALDPLLFRGELNAHSARVVRFERLLTELGVTDPDGEAATQIYRAAYQAAWRLHDDALEVLQACRARGWSVAVLTNYVRSVQGEKAAALGLTSLLGAFLCVEDVPAPKPDPRAYLAACQHLGVSPSQAVMVGDSWVNDVQGAREAGLRAVWLSRAEPLSQRDGVPVVHTLRDLPDVLDGEC